MRRTLAAFLLMTLPAAAQDSATPQLSEEQKDMMQEVTDTPPVVQACDEELWTELLGRPMVEAVAIPEPKRIIPPGTAVTRDYILERTNVDLNEDDEIVRIWCG